MKKIALWSLFAVCVLTVPVVAMLRRPKPHLELPTYGEVPAFTLVDQDGLKFGLADLRGQVWVADFIFTSCASACPRLTGEMHALQVHLLDRGDAQRTRLVSISVDPERDTPRKLREYADQVGVVGRRWKFLTGPAKDIEDAVVNGFKQGIDREKDPGQDTFTILHGTKMVLVDAMGRIRGYYDSNDAAEMARLREHLAALVDRGGV
jgi:protein SCO1/2